MAYDFNSLTKQADEASNRSNFYTDFEDVDPNVLHQISDLTEWIRTKGKGSDVREIVAQLFERTWLEGTKEGNANMEVAKARGTYNTLAERLNETDDNQRQTTTRLAQKVEIQGVGQVTMQNLSQPIKDALTGGSVAVVGTQSAGLPQLTTDIQEGISTWYELQLVFEDGFYNPDNGQIINDAPSGKRTIVQASEGERFKFTGTIGLITTGLCFMDSDNNFIANAFPEVDIETRKYEAEIVCPENTATIRISNYSTSTTKLWKLKTNFNKFAKSEVVEEAQVKIEEQTSKVKTLFGSNDLNFRDNLKWVVGDLNGGNYQPSTTRIRTDVSQAPYDLIVKTQWYSIYVYLWTFDNENMENGTYELFKGDFVIPKGKWFSLIVRSATDNSIISDIKTSSLYKYITVKGLGNPRVSSNLHAVAHRGYSAVAPENTIPAFVYAKKVGFDYIELDIDFTSDGEVVCCHDYTIDRTSNGTGTIRNMTLAQLKTYDFGSWKDSIFTGTKIPTLEEALECCKKIGLKVYIDMNANNMTDSEIDHVIDVVKSYRMMNAVTFIGGQPRAERVLVTAPKARVGFLFYAGSTPLDSVQSIASLNTNDNEIFLNVSYDTLTEALSSACTNAELGLETWTVDYWGNLQSYYKWIDGYTTNNLLPQEAFESTYY
ncbi:TPA: glycerophosphodiester phosphodiesterase [Streptococcus suis]